VEVLPRSVSGAGKSGTENKVGCNALLGAFFLFKTYYIREEEIYILPLLYNSKSVL
jgi:hypothetical protein